VAWPFRLPRPHSCGRRALAAAACVLLSRYAGKNAVTAGRNARATKPRELLSEATKNFSWKSDWRAE
jgi:hypothetical protein